MENDFRIIFNTLCAFALFFALRPQTAFSQGTLQFNQIVDLPWDAVATGTGSYIYADTTVIVPNNKVWKLEGISVSGLKGQAISYGYFTGNGGSEPIMIFLDGTIIYANPNSATATASFVPGNLWIKEGTHALSFRYYNAGTNTIRAFLNVIEFNIIP